MRRFTASAITFLCMAVSWMSMTGQIAYAAQTVPYKLNFQGRLVDSTGSPMPNGTYNIKFRFMNASSGGTNLWEADRVYTGSGTSDHRVQVTNGVFSVQLGDTSTGIGDPALSPSIFNTQTNAAVYLEVELPTPATATCGSVSCASFTEGAMTPRQPVSSATYAINADTVDGIDGASLAQLSANNTFTGSNVFKPSSDSATAFQIQGSGGTPLFVVDTSSGYLKVGGGDVSPDASPALLVLDYKNTSGDPASAVNGAMYYNSSSGKFRCYEGGAWKDCIYSDPNATTSFTYQQDFAAGVSLTPPIFQNGNYAALDSTITAFTNYNNSFISNQPFELNHPGIWRFNTGTTTTGNAFIASPLLNSGANFSLPYMMGQGAWSISTEMRVANTSATGNLYTIYMGLSPTIATPANGCMFRYNGTDFSSNGHWAGACGNGTTETTCDPGVAVAANTWYNLKMAVNTAGTTATFVVNDTNSCTVSSNIPTSTGMSFMLGMLKSTGTTARTMDLDYLDFTYNISGTR